MHAHYVDGGYRSAALTIPVCRGGRDGSVGVGDEMSMVQIALMEKVPSRALKDWVSRLQFWRGIGAFSWMDGWKFEAAAVQRRGVGVDLGCLPRFRGWFC